MEVLKNGWDFLQNEVLGMKWLNAIVGSIVEAVGLDPTGGSIRFFIYDIIKWSTLQTWKRSWNMVL